MTEKRGRKPMLDQAKAEWALLHLQSGQRMSWITGQLGVSRHVIYSAFKRYGLVWPAKEQSK